MRNASFAEKWAHASKSYCGVNIVCPIMGSSRLAGEAQYNVKHVQEAMLSGFRSWNSLIL